MEEHINLLVINPGSTSTKAAIFEDGTERFSTTLHHTAEEVSKYTLATDQAGFREVEVRKFLKDCNYDVTKFTAIVSRGGGLPDVTSGAYEVNDAMVETLRARALGQHASSAGCVIALNIARELGLKAYIYDANTADEMDEIATLSGTPLTRRYSQGHILNTKAIGRRYAASIGKKPQDLVLILVHMGGGISVSLHKNGRVADIYTDEDGTFAPERCGSVPAVHLAKICYSGKYTWDEMNQMLRGGAGLVAYLGTNSAKEVEDRIAQGDERAKLVYEAMAYQTAKCVGGLATAVNGKVDAIILTGGIAYSELFTGMVTERVSFLAPVVKWPGEFEMEALAEGITRVLKGEETAKLIEG